MQAPASHRPKSEDADASALLAAGDDVVPASRGRKSDRPAQRQRILDALFTVMSSSGVGGASVTEIAEAAGIARGALHYYFESKDELLASLMRRLGDAYLDRLQRLLEREAAADVARQRVAVETLGRWHFAGASDEAARLLAVWIDYWGQAPTQAAIGDVVFEVQEGARRACREAILLARPELAVLGDGELRLLSASVLATIEGGLLQWRLAARSAHPFERRPFGEAIGRAAQASIDAVDAVDAADTSAFSKSISPAPTRESL